MQDNLTLSIVLAATILLIGWDVYTIIKRGSNTTISVQLYEFSKRYPIIAFFLGIIFGHIFWPL